MCTILPSNTTRPAIDAAGGTALFRGVKLPAGPGRLEAVLADGETPRGARFVEVRKAK